MILIQVDIVGGSISGLSTAISLKQNDKSIDVIIHEKYKKIGYNHEGRRCGEAHSIESGWKKWMPTGKSIFNEIKTGETIIGKKNHIVHREPKSAFMLNRQEFICQLSKEAEELGAIIQTNDKIKSIKELDCEFIIDASGCPSSIKRELGIKSGLTGCTYQQTLEDSSHFIADTVKFVFSGYFGYYWIFPRDPKKREINLGVGATINIKNNLKEMLEIFKEENKITGKINYVTGGLIPVGIQRPLMYKNILFVGDAGVGSFPLTGQGIYRALVSGDIAGRCIANNNTKKYPYIINQNFIKWDLIGKTFVNMNIVLGNISPNLINITTNFFYDIHGKMH